MRQRLSVREHWRSCLSIRFFKNLTPPAQHQKKNRQNQKGVECINLCDRRVRPEVCENARSNPAQMAGAMVNANRTRSERSQANEEISSCVFGPPLTDVASPTYEAVTMSSATTSASIAQRRRKKSRNKVDSVRDVANRHARRKMSQDQINGKPGG